MGIVYCPPPCKKIIENQENSGDAGENEKIIPANFISKCVKFIKIRTNFRGRYHLHTLLAFVSVFQNLIDTSRHLKLVSRCAT
jgi:hypothetical protein